MPKDYPRTRRVAEQMKRAVSEMIARDLEDPRVRLTTVTDVEVARDLSHAKIFVSVLGHDDPSDAVEALNHAAPRLRGQVGRELRMRVTPTLKFIADQSLVEGQRVSRLINQAVAEDKARHADDKNNDAEGAGS